MAPQLVRGDISVQKSVDLSNNGGLIASMSVCLLNLSLASEHLPHLPLGDDMFNLTLFLPQQKNNWRISLFCQIWSLHPNVDLSVYWMWSFIPKLMVFSYYLFWQLLSAAIISVGDLYDTFGGIFWAWSLINGCSIDFHERLGVENCRVV